MATRRKRQGLTEAKRPTAGRAGVARAVEEHRRAEAKDAKPPRSKATFDIDPELMAELRVASAMASETLTAIAERGLATELQRFRDELMDGKPFPLPVKRRRRRPSKT